MERNPELIAEAELYAQRYGLDKRCLDDLLSQEDHVIREIVNTCTFDIACRNPSAVVTKQIQQVKRRMIAATGGFAGVHVTLPDNYMDQLRDNLQKQTNPFAEANLRDKNGPTMISCSTPSSGKGKGGKGFAVRGMNTTMDYNADHSQMNEAKPHTHEEKLASLTNMRKTKNPVQFDDLSIFVQKFCVPEEVQEVLEKCPEGVLELLETSNKFDEFGEPKKNGEITVSTLAEHQSKGELQHRCSVHVFVRDVQGLEEDTKHLLIQANRKKQLAVLMRFGTAMRKGELIDDLQVQALLGDPSKASQAIAPRRINPHP